MNILHFNPRSPHGERPFVVRSIAAVYYFNPRSPHGERHKAFLTFPAPPPIFQPTLPARGATQWKMQLSRCKSHFNPRSPHGERRDLVTLTRRDQGISTHAPRTGSDAKALTSTPFVSHFNPRSPHGERRHDVHKAFCVCNFNPRSPHGERRDGQPKRTVC